jgi:hypothetical protein
VLTLVAQTRMEKELPKEEIQLQALFSLKELQLVT